ncbi:sulfatase-like hydrolase/transferase [Marinoscillum furvescens]|uniref:Arylsulfatase A-like enzyme n=1 Tax=Marinoscillum furvescens DSM 4134 TaxID=1122208 RepID=A0A3D9KZY0_MARFU|nr:sulfatase-like hydrolase/transferase [Marinoscillum furvescens]RED94972.1 arylsulfatase A-like enzyme [Marinoscillum furvescens DSM 4134]
MKALSGLYLLAILWLLVSCTAQQDPNPPVNVVLILTDDLGYGDISCYSDSAVHTPAIDRLAKEGVKFTDFYVPTPYCAPSRATLLTGRFPLRHGLILNPTPDAGIDDVGLATNEYTLGEDLQAIGYQTALIGKWHLGHLAEYYPVRHGFDQYLGILYSNDMRPVQLMANDGDTVAYPVDQRTLTQRYTQEAVGFIRQNQNRPFFLMLSHAMPHKPLAASRDFYTPETPDDLYSDVIRELDWSVSQVMAELEARALLENTIVIFMSDNGPWYGGSTGGLKGMKATTWEGGIRVPFIVYYPKQFEPTVVETPCWSPDVFATLRALTNSKSPLPNPIDGVDLTGLMTGEHNDHPPVFSMHGDQVTSVRQGAYKLFLRKSHRQQLPVDWVDPRGPDGTTILAPLEQAGTEDYPGVIPDIPARAIQLYDLTSDPTESKNLAVQMPEKVAAMKKLYEDYLKSMQ